MKSLLVMTQDQILVEKLSKTEFPEVLGKIANRTAGNRNADKTRGEWIIFLDDDYVAQGGFLGVLAYCNSVKPKCRYL